MTTNENIFRAVGVSRVSKVPILLLGNPGVGKTTSIELYAYRNGMAIESIHGNQVSNEEVSGFRVVSDEEKKTELYKPDWYVRIMDRHKKGIDTVLFLDEITTSPELVQASFLNIIFDRIVGSKENKLPEGCLVIAAGNYAQNLSSSSSMISPLLNRFCIVNLAIDESDLETFLSRYQQSMFDNGDGEEDQNKFSFGEKSWSPRLIEFLRREEDALTSNKKEGVDDNFIKSIFETKIKDTIIPLIRKRAGVSKSGSISIDLNIQNLRNQFSDSKEEPVYGFVTPRTLCYLVEISHAMYSLYGTEGISSDLFQNMVNGLVGISFNYPDSDKGRRYNPTQQQVGNLFFEAIRKGALELDKQSDKTLLNLENILRSYKKDMISLGTTKIKAGEDLSHISQESIVSITKSLVDLNKSPKHAASEIPISENVLKDFCLFTAKNISSCARGYTSLMKSKAEGDYESETIIDLVEKWNQQANLFLAAFDILSSTSRGYSSSAVNAVHQEGVVIFERTKKDLDTLIHAYCMSEVYKEIKKGNTQGEVALRESAQKYLFSLTNGEPIVLKDEITKRTDKYNASKNKSN